LVCGNMEWKGGNIERICVNNDWRGGNNENNMWKTFNEILKLINYIFYSNNIVCYNWCYYKTIQLII
jgi:hypothetical protein